MSADTIRTLQARIDQLRAKVRRTKDMKEKAAAMADVQKLEAQLQREQGA